MFSSVQLRPIQIACDAPAYEIVKASGRLGMRSPQDVRWRRLALPNLDAATRKSWLRRVRRLLFAFGTPEVEETCACGNTLPERRVLLLRANSGLATRYALTQCGRCRTIIWDKEHTPSLPRGDA